MVKLFNNNIIRLVIFMNLIIVFSIFKSTYIRFAFLFIFIIASLFSVKKLNNYRYKSIMGLPFFITYFIGIILGLVYGHDKNYVLINFALMSPWFFILFFNSSSVFSINKNINTLKKISFVAAIFTILLYFFWDKIGFIKAIVLKNQDSADEAVGFLNKFSEDEDSSGRSFRAVGFFKDAYTNGIFLIFGYIAYIEEYILNKNRLKFLAISSVFITAIYATQTRNVYMLLGVVFCIYVLLNSFLSRNSKIFFRTLFLFYVSIIIVVFLYAASKGFEIHGDSILARFYSWSVIVLDYLFNEKSLFNVFFGYGLTQYESDFSPTKNYWAIDNDIMAIFLGSGLIGVFLFLRWIRKLFDFLLKEYNKSKNDIQKKSFLRLLIVSFSVLFLGGVFNINLYNFCFIVPLLFLLKMYLISEDSIS